MSKFAKLKELCSKIGSGATPTGGEDSYKKQGVSLIRSQNVQDLYFVKKGLAYIDAEQAKKLNNVEVKENDVLLNITGDSIARACMVPNEILPARVNQHVSILRVNEKIDANYLLYYLIFRKDYLLTICRVGGTRNALTKEAIENIDIRIDKNDKKISAVLSALDDKIDLNNKINAELEAIAKTLYDYWFVQFDFPDENGKPYKSSGGKMEYNGVLKREIPKGWKVQSLEDFGELKNGINYDPQEKGDCTAKIINVRNISSSTIFIDVNGLDSIQLRLKDVEKYLVNRNSIIIARSGIPGATRLIDNHPENTIYCGFIIHFDVTDNVFKNVLFYNIKSLESNLTGQSNGTIMKNVNQQVLKELKVCLPSDTDIVSSFNSKINPIFSQITNNHQQNQELANLRDWLLPMLMNGQIKVGDLDQKVMSSQVQPKGKKQVPVNSSQLEMLF